jgi:hypothetical protein
MLPSGRFFLGLTWPYLWSAVAVSLAAGVGLALTAMVRLPNVSMVFLLMEIQSTGAKLKLEPWDGDIFTARLMPLGQYAAVVQNLGPLPNGFVQFQIDKDAKLNLLRLSFDDGQAYGFKRE